MDKFNCDACGSDQIKKIDIQETRQLPLGPEFTYLIPSYKCEKCGEEGDFAHEADKIRELQMQRAHELLAIKLIGEIADSGIRLAYIERAFQIPQRTISSKWRTGKISAAGLALLRIIRTMPWIVDIADQKFSKKSIMNTVLAAIAEMTKEAGGEFSLSHGLGEENKLHVQITQKSDSVTVDYQGMPMISST
jgi:hypothetical protein